MIFVKTPEEIEQMREACEISAGALKLAGQSAKPGMTTKELDNIIHKYIISKGAKPSFLGYGGFPGSACISINDEVIHGIPGSRKILNGDIISVDVGAYKNGFHGDNAYTFAVGCLNEVDDDIKKLMTVTEQSLMEAIKVAKPGNRIGDISNTIETCVRAHGYGVVKQFIGHGVGRELHEAPEIPNFGPAGKGVRLCEGMTLAIEPMINLIGDDIYIMPDEWTVKTKSGSVSVHFEHTIVVTENGGEILTKSPVRL